MKISSPIMGGSRTDVGKTLQTLLKRFLADPGTGLIDLNKRAFAIWIVWSFTAGLVFLLLLVGFSFSWLFGLSFLFAAAWLITKVIEAVLIKVPAGFVGVEDILGWRTGVVFNEGLFELIPFVTVVHTFSKDIQTLLIEAVVTTQVGGGQPVKLTIKGNVNWSIDEAFSEQVQRFFLVSEKTIKDGLENEIEDVLRVIVGQYGLDYLIDHGLELQLAILLHLLEPEVELTDPKQGAKYKAVGYARKLCLEKEREGILERLEAHHDRVHQCRKEGTECATCRSRLERRYGIYIHHFSLASIEYDEETRRALQLEFQAQHQLDAASRLLEWLHSATLKLRDAGVPEVQRGLYALVLMDKVKAQSFIIPGIEQAAPALARTLGKLSSEAEKGGQP